MSKTYFLVGLLISIIVFGLLLLRRNEDTWICKNGNWTKHGNPNNPPPQEGCGSSETSELKDSDKINLMKVTSSAFENNTKIPSRYTCDGENVNPPLTFEDLPENTQSLVLIVNDPDAPAGNWIHWILFNIPADTEILNENDVPTGALQGINSFGDNNYGGPCPPSGTHRYIFKLFAIDSLLDLKEGTSEAEIKNGINGHTLETSELVGKYR